MKLRTRSFLLAVIVVLTTFVLTSVPAPHWVGGKHIPGARNLTFVAQASGGNYAKYDVIANIASGVNVRDVASRHNLPILKNLADTIYLFRLQTSDPRTVDQAVAELKTDSGVVWAEPNYFLTLPELSGLEQQSTASVDQQSTGFVDGLTPTAYFGQYAATLMQTAQAQVIAKGTGVTVAVIDTGIDASHPVFKSVTAGYNFVDNNNNPAEVCCGSGYGHGTMVSGCIALVAPGATIMPLRAFDSTGTGTASNIGNAIRWAVNNGANVINMSFTMADSAGVIQSAISYAASHGVVMIAAAGNQNTSVAPYPASDPNVLAVAATDQYDVKATFSNYGSWVAVSAPGVSIESAYPGGQWAVWSGTSFSVPFVSGEAALLLSIRRSTDRIKSTAVPVGSGLGSGRINCLAAVSP